MSTVWLVMTRTCNLDCSYCYQGSHAWTWQKDKGLVKHMSDEVMERTLKWSLNWSKPNELRFIFYGGEPLLMKDLIFKWTPIYRKAFEASGRKVKFSCTSNGTLLNQELREFFDENDINVMVSLDGPPWIHNEQRQFYGGKPSWEKIPVDDLLKWRPTMEFAWQVDPQRVPVESDLDWMLTRGFRRLNFNLNWLPEWTAEQRLKLTEFMRRVARQAIRERNKGHGFRTNLFSKFNEIFLKDDRAERPCGTGLRMLAVSPEGWLYPSQEMVFTVVEPNRAPGTETYYRVGDVNLDPVINQERLAVVSDIKNDQMRTPEGFDCTNCAARKISFGGCHCRYVGADGTDPENRYDVLPGWCQTEQAWVTGFLQAAVIEDYLTFKMVRPAAVAKPANGRVDLGHVSRQIDTLNKKLDNLDIVRIEPA